MNKNLLAVLIFVLVLVVCFWAMPNMKIDTIGDFFEKIIKPVSIPLSALIAVRHGIVKYIERKNGNKKEQDYL
ncbi:hypothetical protein [Maribacter cobaltidurans]|uniref:Uncharacterized protein n=1 Tax=Maribacter cobaltidurans TaxID=1178778 RepID=A0A223V5M1_9FLAO|nr:hypothetical protein [Maribacter cobaltidurans]ASV30308.1 hypothetical protein CJ263_08810 [Maribacter cobaltidurans]